MKYDLYYSKRFTKSLKRIKQLPNFKPEQLKKIIRLLSHGEKLEIKHRDHKLSGDMLGYRECHIAPDILLIYEINNGILTLTLINIGSHSQLFK